MNENSPIIIGQRGTPEWHIHYLRRDSLVALMNDLVDRENDGLEEHQCAQVKACLEKLSNVASALPDGGIWKSAIFEEMEEFSEIYYQWNSHSGPEAPRKRRSELKRLRTQRNKLARRWRKNQHELANEFDLKMATAMHGAVHDLVKAVPEIFKSLAKSAEEFAKIMSKVS